jgi:hypothetical protein
MVARVWGRLPHESGVTFRPKRRFCLRGGGNEAPKGCTQNPLRNRGRFTERK